MSRSRLSALPTTVFLLLATPQCGFGDTPVPAASDTLYASGSPYLIHDYGVLAGDTLVVEAGVTVMFLAGGFLEVVGTLKTLGNAGAPVVFTSADSTPVPGDWGGILLHNGAVIDFSHTWVEYGGDSGKGNLITLTQEPIRHVAQSVRWVGGGTRYSATTGIETRTRRMELRNLEVSENTSNGAVISFPDSAPPVPPILDSLVFTDNGGEALDCQYPGSIPGTLSGSGNGYNGITIWGGVGAGASPGTWTWAANEGFPYIIRYDVGLGLGSTLEIAPGAVVKFLRPEWNGLRYNNFMEVSGGATLRAGEPGGRPVFFTSIHDDLHGGDTKGDGSDSLAAPGDVKGVFAQNGGNLDLHNTWFLYGGGPGAIGGLSTSEGQRADKISWHGGGSLYSAQHGVYVRADSVSFASLLATENALTGFTLNVTGPATAYFSDIYGNGGCGVVNEVAVPGSLIDARNCWWGDVSGPLHPRLECLGPLPGCGDTNPDGSGDGVSDCVLFDQWAGGPLVRTSVPEDKSGGPIKPNHAPGLIAMPNPVAGVVQLRLTLSEEQSVTLEVFDILGRLVRSLEGRRLVPGTHAIEWDGTDESGNPAASGVYYIRCAEPGPSRVSRVVLIR